MPTLSGSPVAVPLGEGVYAILAPGLRGSASLSRPPDALARARSRGLEDGTAALDQAFAATEITEIRRVEVVLMPTPGPAPAQVLRSSSGDPAIELQVPDLGPETGQLVLAIDEHGAMTWHAPLDAGLRVETSASRGRAGVKRFRIPARPVTALPAAAAGEQRSLIGIVGRQLLKVLVYPITDPIVGALGELFAARWEARHRAPLLRSLTPQNRRTPRAGALAAGDWPRLASGRALFFVHGTFSTAHAGFGSIPDPVFESLFELYGGRVFAYDHPTMATDPTENVRWLLDQAPPGTRLEVDVVCHSRGGLVSRALAERPSVFGLQTSAWNVGTLVLVAVPNGGTLLAHPDHMVAMIDRLTTALNVLPSGPIVETLEALITAVKVIGHGALKSLAGLAAMEPGGKYLKGLNAGAPEGRGYRAVAVDFEPPGEGALASVIGRRLADHVLDIVFEGAANDLVVPELGVFSANGSGAFPIEAGSLLRVSGNVNVIHTTVFGHPPVGEALLKWLAAPAPAT